MNEVLITHTAKATTPPIRATYCTSFLCRLRGLMFRKQIDPEEGLLLVGKRENRLDAAIHMLGVGTDLAVFWLDDRLEIVDQRLAKSWHPLYIPRKPARYVLELSPERFHEFKIGDRVRFEEISMD